jgi:hypothetical protein
MAFDIVALDFPVAFAASPRVYTMVFPAVRIFAMVNGLPVSV